MKWRNKMKRLKVMALIITLLMFLTACKTTLFFSEPLDSDKVLEQVPHDFALEASIADLSHYALSETEIERVTDEMHRQLAMFDFHYNHVDEYLKAVFQLIDEEVTEEDEFTEILLTFMKESVKFDAGIMKEAKFHMAPSFKINFEEVRVDSSNAFVYIPMIAYVEIVNADSIDMTPFAEELALEFEEMGNAQSVVELRENMTLALESYVGARGQFLILFNEYVTYDLNTQKLQVESLMNLDLGLDNAFDPGPTYLSSNWSKTSIDEMLALNIIPDYLFYDYTMVIDREDFSILMSNVIEYNEGVSLSYPLESPFEDTMHPAILKLYALGYVNGVSEHHFDPYGSLTREQAARIVAQYHSADAYDYSQIDKYFKDHDQIGNWAKPYVYNVRQSGIMIGSNDMFLPKEALTVEQAVTLLHRLVKP